MSNSTEDSFQVSPQQARLWSAEPGGPSARVQAVLRIDGEVELDSIAAGLRAAVERHESLRTTFRSQAGLTLPVQVVHAALEPRIERLDLRDADRPEQATRLASVYRSELDAPLDLARGPLLRAVLVSIQERRSELILTVSALCADATSTALLLGELASRLAHRDLSEDPLQYADFSAWQHELSDSEEDEARASRGFWREQAGVRSPTLPFTSLASSAGAMEDVTVELGEALATTIAEQAARYGVTPSAFVQAAWHAVLGRFSGEELSVVAFLAGERRHSDLEGAVGAFQRPVPVRARLDATRSFAEVLAAVGRAREEALVQQDYAPSDGAGAVEIGFLEYSGHLNQPEGLSLGIGRLLYAEPELRLLAICAADEHAITLSLAFDAARHRRTSVSGLAHGLVRLLESVASDPSIPLASIEILGEEERERLLGEFNDTGTSVAQECVHELIARWAQSAPQRTAVTDGESTITYAELDARANQLAHRLKAAGVGAEVGVGLCTDRSIEMVVGLLGILKAGGAYVPLHHEHPPARLHHQLVSAGARALVTQKSLLDALPPFEGELVCLDRDRAELEREPTDAPSSGVTRDGLAYVIYTSGSTGTPKGVSVSHANLANYAADIIARVGGESEPSSFGLVTSISTDLGNTSVFGALCSGGTLVLVPPGAAADPGAFAGLLEATPVDVLKITPSHLGALLAAEDPRVLPRRLLILGGERSSWDLIGRVRALSDCAILNHYGPTETTIGSCTFVVGEGPGEYAPASVPIGRPISNTSCYVLDEHRHLAPIGVPGRLFIAGAGVARGYAGEPELSAERFSADPFAAQEEARMYDTGDLARWLGDGTLEFMGRVDEQVKIRGYRVEPAEIETALSSHPEVREALAVAQPSPTGDMRLVAYCTVQGSIDEAGLRAHLADWLPQFMLPGAIVIVDSMPRTPSGKIDRMLLPDPDLVSAQGGEYVAPRTPMEETLSAIWAEVLGVERLGVEDDFFALGGHSLLATQVVARVRSDFAIDLPLHSLFTYPTVASLAGEIISMMGDSEAGETAQLMAELESMSEEEAQRLLAEDAPPEIGRR